MPKRHEPDDDEEVVSLRAPTLSCQMDPARTTPAASYNIAAADKTRRGDKNPTIASSAVARHVPAATAPRFNARAQNGFLGIKKEDSDGGFASIMTADNTANAGTTAGTDGIGAVAKVPRDKRDAGVGCKKGAPNVAMMMASDCIQPGAVSVTRSPGGITRIRNRAVSSPQQASMSSFDNLATSGPSNRDLAIAAEVAPIQVDLEARLQNLEQEMHQRLEHQRQEILGQAVRADVVTTTTTTTTNDENKEPEPEPEPIKEPVDLPEPKPPNNCWKWWVGIIVVVVVIIGAIGAGVGVALSSGSKKDSKGETPPVDPTPPPTVDPTPPPPTAAPTNHLRFQVLGDRLMEVFGESLLDESSVQFRTLEWLVYDDPAMLPESSTALPTLTERFVVALLYFATRGENWDAQYRFLTNSSVCEWHNPQQTGGIACSNKGRVEMIQLNGTNLQERIPTELMVLRGLTLLDLRDNFLSGSIPEEIRNIRSLKHLDLSGNLISGMIPSVLGELPGLQVLTLGPNALTGSIPSAIHQLPNLVALFLWENLLTGTMPPYNGMNALETALYDENDLSGTIPSSIALLTTLDTISFSNNDLTGTIPSFSGNGVLRRFWADGNRLSGGMDDFFASVRGSPLEFFDVNKCQLSGTIPSAVEALTGLVVLDFEFNQLRGTLPTELGDLTRLSSLDLGPNGLSGTIPTELGRLTALRFFDCNQNDFNGTLPSELGNLVNVNTVSFGDTRIGGTVPVELRKLVPNLDTFWIAFTDITGDLNPVFCSSVRSVPVLRSNCIDEVVCDCCTECCTDYNGTCFPNN